MAHKHSVYDTDNHFMIDGVTRVVKNASQTKTMLIQHDHNSERFTFEIPRYIDDHDMSTCNVVQVHYINIDASTKEQKTGIYEVVDLHISPEYDDVVVCSWLISRNATQLVGSLNFLIRFCCVTDGVVDYAWNTATHSNVHISSGINADETFESEYVDVIEQWKASVLQGFEDKVTSFTNDIMADVEQSVEDLKKDLTTSVLQDVEAKVTQLTAGVKTDVENVQKDVKNVRGELGGKMDKGVISYYHPSDKDETALNEWLESTVLPSMPDNTCKNVSICCGAIDPMILMGVVYKNTNSWVIVDVVSHVNGHHYTKAKNGDWKNTVVNDSVFTNGEINTHTSYFPNPKACKFFIVNVTIGTINGEYYHSFAVDTHTLKDSTPRYFNYDFPFKFGETTFIGGCKLKVTKREEKKDIAFILSPTGEIYGASMTRIVGYC